jgi:head-tail adaptor
MDASRLRNKIDIYGKVPFVNALGEDDFTYDIVNTIRAEIVMGSGDLKDSQSDTSYADINYKITIRANAMPDLANDMYIMFKGQRYNIKYFNPNYKYRDSIEIFCSLVVE